MSRKRQLTGAAAVLLAIVSVRQSLLPERAVIEPLVYGLLYGLTLYCAAWTLWPGQAAELCARFTLLRWLRNVVRAGCLLLAGLMLLLTAWPAALPPTEQAAPWIVVLGAPVVDDAPTDLLLSRTDAAAVWLLDHPGTRALLCGGRAASRTEARVMQERMAASGVAPERVLLEQGSRSTLENIQAAAALLPDTDAPVVIVTNRFHCLRTSLYAAKFGLRSVTFLPVGTPIHAAPVWLLREALMLVRYWLTGL